MKRLSKRLIKKKIHNDLLVKIEKEYTTVLKNAKFASAFLAKFQEDANAYKISTSRSGDGYLMTVSISSLNSFKDDTLTKLLGLLLAYNPIDTSSTEYAIARNIDYHFIFPGIKVVVYAYVKEDSPTCRKVIISQEEVIETRYTYKMVCD